MGGRIHVITDARELNDLCHQDKQGQCQHKEIYTRTCCNLGNLIEGVYIQKNENAQHSKKSETERNPSP